MDRPFPELLADYDADPTRWDVIHQVAVPSTNAHNRGGTSVQEILRNRYTGEEMVRHSLLRPNGSPFRAPHFRRNWK